MEKKLDLLHAVIHNTIICLKQTQIEWQNQLVTDGSVKSSPPSFSAA